MLKHNEQLGNKEFSLNMRGTKIAHHIIGLLKNIGYHAVYRYDDTAKDPDFIDVIHPDSQQFKN